MGFDFAPFRLNMSERRAARTSTNSSSSLCWLKTGFLEHFTFNGWFILICVEIACKFAAMQTTYMRPRCETLRETVWYCLLTLAGASQTT
jgi:hypothetical protein